MVIVCALCLLFQTTPVLGQGGGQQPPVVKSAPQKQSAPQAPADQTATEQTSQRQPQRSVIWNMVIFMVLLFGIFYVFLILPQRRREKERRAMLSALRKNDKVVTIGGIHGVVHSIKDDRVVIKVDENTKITVSMSAIAGVERAKEEDKKE